MTPSLALPTSPVVDQVPAIEARNLSRILRSGSRDLTVLDAVNFRIPVGQFVAVVGPSGSGKSTLLGLLAGLDRPSSGSVLLHGQAIEAMSEDALALLRRRGVGFVFQSFQLLSHFTAVENVILPLELLGEASPRQRAMELLKEVGLEQRADHFPAQLSGGEQQRVALARAFAPRPAILLADEPTGNLDSANGQIILQIMQNLRRQQHTTLVMVTHDMALTRLAQRVITLEDGRVQSDTAGESDV